MAGAKKNAHTSSGAGKAGKAEISKGASAAKKESTTTKASGKIPASSNRTTPKQYSWTPAKGGVVVAGPKARKYAKEHSMIYYVMNISEQANALIVIIFGEKDIKLTSWMSKIADDVIRQDTGDFYPIPFFNGTFHLHDDDGIVMQNDRDQ